MQNEYDVAIIGTGTAALAAAYEVEKVTDNFIIVSAGSHQAPYVRTGGTPSQVFIEATQQFHQRHTLAASGISGAEQLKLDSAHLLAHVRQAKERLLEETRGITEKFRPHMREGKIRFHSCTGFDIDGKACTAKRIVLASGSKPVIPEALNTFPVITSDTLFDLKTLPPDMVVVGMNALGTEMAQALCRAGVKVTALHDSPFIAGLTDAAVNEYAIGHLRQDIPLTILPTSEMVRHPSLQKASAVFVATGRKANLEDMGLDALGIIQPGEAFSDFNPLTMQVGDLPLFIAGDVKKGRSMLHAAVDEGQIAGFNAARDTVTAFSRRVPLQIVHTSPAIATVGVQWARCDKEHTLVGKAVFDNHGPATLSGPAQGIIHIYANKVRGKIIGAELMAPGGEHIAHLLASWVQLNVPVSQALKSPFYHPSLEEYLQTALNDLASQIDY